MSLKSVNAVASARKDDHTTKKVFLGVPQVPLYAGLKPFPRVLIPPAPLSLPLLPCCPAKFIPTNMPGRLQNKVGADVLQREQEVS